MRLDEVDAQLPVGTIVAVSDAVGDSGDLADLADLAVIRLVDGWVAVPDACPHAGCAFSVDGELADDGTLICNCHGSEFDPMTGDLRLGPATSGLAVRRLKVERNRLNFASR
jgi:Rieske Fe-S protein